MRRNNFYTLAKMKKENDLIFCDNGRRKIFIDLKGLENAFITREMMGNLTAFLFPIICGLFVYLMIALWIVFGY